MVYTFAFGCKIVDVLCTTPMKADSTHCAVDAQSQQHDEEQDGPKGRSGKCRNCLRVNNKHQSRPCTHREPCTHHSWMLPIHAVHWMTMKLQKLKWIRRSSGSEIRLGIKRVSIIWRQSLTSTMTATATAEQKYQLRDKNLCFCHIFAQPVKMAFFSKLGLILS